MPQVMSDVQWELDSVCPVCPDSCVFSPVNPVALNRRKHSYEGRQERQYLMNNYYHGVHGAGHVKKLVLQTNFPRSSPVSRFAVFFV